MRLALTDKGAFERQLSARFLPQWASEHQRRLLTEVLRAVETDPGSCIWRFYWILHTGEGTIIGDAGFKGPPDHEGSVEIAYGIVPSYRRQGYTFEAVEALARWAFTRPDVRQITA